MLLGAIGRALSKKMRRWCGDVSPPHRRIASSKISPVEGYPRKAKAALEFPGMRGDDFLRLDAVYQSVLVLRKALTKGKLHSLEDLDYITYIHSI